MAMLIDGQLDDGLRTHPSRSDFVHAPSAFDVDFDNIDGHISYSG